MTSPTTMLRLLDAIGEHLATYRLSADVSTVTAGSTAFDGEQVTVQLRPFQLAGLATALLGWVDTLTGVTVTAWRPPHGKTVHLRLTGQLPDATDVLVYGGVDYTDALFGDLQPGGRHTVALSVLRAWAAGNTAVAA
jgi:secreted protein with Ig-like and vWFA domain